MTKFNIDNIPAYILKEYMVESVHDDWYGFTEQHKKVLHNLVTDMVAYNSCRPKQHTENVKPYLLVLEVRLDPEGLTTREIREQLVHDLFDEEVGMPHFKVGDVGTMVELLTNVTDSRLIND